MGDGTSRDGSVWYCFWRHRPNNVDFTLPKSVDLPLLKNVDSKLLVTGSFGQRPNVPGAGSGIRWRGSDRHGMQRG